MDLQSGKSSLYESIKHSVMHRKEEAALHYQRLIVKIDLFNYRKNNGALSLLFLSASRPAHFKRIFITLLFHYLNIYIN